MTNVIAEQKTETQVLIEYIISRTIYPLSWLVIITMFYLGVSGHLELRTAWGIVAAILLLSFILIETLLPLQNRWGMTWPNFVADVKYIVLNGSFLGIISALLAWFTITMSGDLSGPANDSPIWVQIPVLMLIFEACQYAIHRAMHEGKHVFNRFLWKVHAPHHLPNKLYVLMHPVGHPLNGFFIQTLTMVVPIWLMGYDQIAVTAFLMMNSLHGLIAHFNFDARMGWMNYIFVGTELHRYHHSSALREAKNFGALLSIYDQLFGTFVYRPGVLPENLGAFNQDIYPDYCNVSAMLKLPFESTARQSGKD